MHPESYLQYASHKEDHYSLLRPILLPYLIAPFGVRWGRCDGEVNRS
jgi:hypothetical protein